MSDLKSLYELVFLNECLDKLELTFARLKSPVTIRLANNLAVGGQYWPKYLPIRILSRDTIAGGVLK
jgi:hypothetical protein